MAEENCESKLLGDFIKKCGYRPKQGLRNKWYFNFDDVDREASQLANRGTKVSLLVLKVGAKLYKAGGNDKTNRINHALAVGDFGNGHIHTDGFTVLYNGEEERERVQELVEGARVGTIVEKVDTGVNGELTFEIAGYEAGMAITEHNYNSAENSGTVTVTVASKEGEEEATGLKLFLLAGGAEATRTFITTNTYVRPVENVGG